MILSRPAGGPQTSAHNLKGGGMMTEFETQTCKTCIYWDGECTVGPNAYPDNTGDSPACELWDDGRYSRGEAE